MRELSVAGVCRAAGVTRETFYRHAPSVTVLLADALSDDLAACLAETPAAAPLGEAERLLLEHIWERAAVYRGAMDPLLVAPVRERIEDYLRVGLGDLLVRRPQLLPPALRGDDLGARIAVAYAAAGTVGAIEAWLLDGAGDVDHAVRAVLEASPQWWLAAE